MEDWSPDKEREAVEAAKRDPREFVRLYEAYADRIYRYLLARLRHVETAEDLTQETFLKALAAMPKYQWRGVPFGAWIFRIAINTLRSTVSRLQLTAPADEETLDRLGAPEARLQPKIDASLVWDHARLLTEEQQEALALRFNGDLPIAEIAASMGKSEAAVKMLLQRAIKTLSEKMTE